MRAMRVAVQVAWRHAVERAELHPAEAWSIGRDRSCSVVVDHPSVAAHHAQVILRRGRFIVCPRGPLSIRHAGTEIRAPVALNAQDEFQLGDITVSLFEPTGPTWAELRPILGPVQREWSTGADLRIFDLGGGLEGYAAALAPSQTHTQAVASAQVWRGDLKPGVRLRAIMRRMEDDSLKLLPEVAVALIGQIGTVLQRLHETGPVGGVGPDTVHLGQDGQVQLLRAGPCGPQDEAYQSPERRLGGPVSRHDDAYAFASLGIRLLRLCGGPDEAWSALSPLLQSAPQRRSLGLQQAAVQVRRLAEGGGLDATAAHLARAVRLIWAQRGPVLLVRSPG